MAAATDAPESRSPSWLATLLAAPAPTWPVEVTERAILRLWRELAIADNRDCDGAAWLLWDLDARRWRRLGRLLFAAEPASTAGVVVAILEALVALRPDAAWGRVWASEWRGLLIDKLRDVHRRPGFAGLAVRLVRLLAGVCAWGSASLAASAASASATAGPGAKELVGLLELLLELSEADDGDGHEQQPPYAACASLRALGELLREHSGDWPEDVREFVSGASTWSRHVKWLAQRARQRQRGRRPDAPISTAYHRHRRHAPNANAGVDDALVTTREALTWEVLAVLAEASPAFPERLLAGGDGDDNDDDDGSGGGGGGRGLVVLVLGGVHTTTAAIQRSALRLLEASLRSGGADDARGLVAALRLEGGILTLTWLLGHGDPELRARAASILARVRHSCYSNPADLARALLEQGAVVAAAISHAATATAAYGSSSNNNNGTTVTIPASEDPDAPTTALVRWLEHVLVLDDDANQSDNVDGPLSPSSPSSSALEGVVAALRRSSNHRLQRNVIVSMLVLRAASPRMRRVIDASGVLELARETVLGAADPRLGAALLQTAALALDKRSMLRWDEGHRRGTDENDAANKDDDGSDGDRIELVSGDGRHVVAISGRRLRRHCRRRLPRAPAAAPTTPTTRLQLPTASAGALEALAQLLGPLPVPSVVPMDTVQAAELLQLARVLDCPLLWHHATRAVLRVDARGTPAWTSEQLWALAASQRHPGLMRRALEETLKAVVGGGDDRNDDDAPAVVGVVAWGLWAGELARS